MKIYDAAFYAATLFIVGVGIANSDASIGAQWLIAAMGVVTLGIYWYRAYRVVAATLLAFALLGGVAYDRVWTSGKTTTAIIFGRLVELRGIVRDVYVDDQKQIIRIGQVQMQTDVYPSYEYGDELRVRGKIQEPFEKQKNVLLKNNVRGLMYHPEIERMATRKGNVVQAALLGVKRGVESQIKKFFSGNEASLLTGLLVGGRGVFDAEFRQKLAASGTTHLVALSGYNIAIVAGFVASILFYLRMKSQALRLILSMVFIAAFVAGTGAESSVVRAGIMGGIVMLAESLGRVYSARNAIAIVGAAMLIQNPKLLLFDAGFQLSFVALMGIIYLQPVIRRWARLEGEPGIFEWKKNLAATVAAQLAVLPILLKVFGSVSWVGVVANVAILWFVPYIMGLGFVVVLISFISSTLAWIIAVPTSALLKYAIAVIEWSSRIGINAMTYNINALEIFIYYLMLLIVIKKEIASSPIGELAIKTEEEKRTEEKRHERFGK